jgi:hypothetical protein
MLPIARLVAFLLALGYDNKQGTIFGPWPKKTASTLKKHAVFK